MPKKPKGQWGGLRIPSEEKRRPGYAGSRDAEGLTPRQRLDTRKAELAELELKERRGELIPRDKVEAERSETAQIIKADLGALPMQIGAALRLAPDQVRVVGEIVAAMVGGWTSAGKVDRAG